MPGGDTRTVELELDAERYERFAAATATAGTSPEAALADLAAEYVELRHAVDTYVRREEETTGASGTDGDVDATGDDDLADATAGDDADTDGSVFETLAEVRPPIGVLVGFEQESIEPGRAVLSLVAGPEHANPMGTLHGGVLCDLGDAAMGTAYASTLAADESFTTLELDCKYRKPVWSGRLEAEASVVESGRTTGLVECDVTDETGSLVARLQSVCLTLRGEDAAGR